MFNNKINMKTAITVFSTVYIKIYAICDNIALLFYKPLKDRVFCRFKVCPTNFAER